MVLYYYFYGAIVVGGAITASNVYFSDKKAKDGQVLFSAFQRGLRYGLIWPFCLHEIHSSYVKGEDWKKIFKP